MRRKDRGIQGIGNSSVGLHHRPLEVVVHPGLVERDWNLREVVNPKTSEFKTKKKCIKLYSTFITKNDNKHKISSFEFRFLKGGGKDSAEEMTIQNVELHKLISTRMNLVRPYTTHTFNRKMFFPSLNSPPFFPF